MECQDTVHYSLHHGNNITMQRVRKKLDYNFFMLLRWVYLCALMENVAVDDTFMISSYIVSFLMHGVSH